MIRRRAFSKGKLRVSDGIDDAVGEQAGGEVNENVDINVDDDENVDDDDVPSSGMHCSYEVSTSRHCWKNSVCDSAIIQPQPPQSIQPQPFATKK